MKLFTYHANVPGINLENEFKLILLWIEHHRKLGYEPVVLNEYIAKKEPRFEVFNEVIRVLPNINPPEYERACYLRWLAMAQIGGGIMMDYDCFIYDPKPIKKVPAVAALKSPICYQQYVPSLFSGNQNQFNHIVDIMIKYEVTEKDNVMNGRAHVSDMYMIENGTIPVDRRDLVKNYGEPGWETAPAVHYSNGSMQPAGKMPRVQWIPKLRS